MCQDCLVSEAAAASQCWRLMKCLFQCGFSFQGSEIQPVPGVEFSISCFSLINSLKLLQSCLCHIDVRLVWIQMLIEHT